MNFTALNGGSSGLNLSNYNATSSSTSTYTNPSAQNGVVYVNGSPSPSPTPSVSTSSYPTRSNTYRYNSTSSQSSNTPSPQAAPPVIPIKISSINSHFYFSLGQIIISCNENVTGTLKYGTNPKNLINQISNEKGSSTQIFKLSPSQLTPGTKYYYQVVLNGPNQATYTSPINSFETKGLNATLLVLDSKDKRATNLKIFIDNDKKYLVTNSKGIIELTDMTPGIHKISYFVNKKRFMSYFFVQNLIITSTTNYQSTSPQNLAVILASYNQKGPNYVWIWLSIGALIIIFIAGYILSKYLKNMKFLKNFDLHRDLKINSPHIN